MRLPRASKITPAALAFCAFIGITLPVNVSAANASNVVVSARVVPTVKVNVHASPSFDLNEEAARTRSAHIDTAATVDVFCNQGPYALKFDVLDADVEEVEVEGLPEQVRLGTGTTIVWLGRPASNRASYVLAYKVRLAEGVAPGTRTMPVRVSFGGV